MSHKLRAGGSCWLASMLILGACAGGESASPVPSPQGAFTVDVTPTEVTLQARGTVTVSVTVHRLDGFAEALEVSMPDLPVGIAADPLVLSAAQSSGELVLRSSGTEASTRVPVTVRVVSSGRTSTAPFTLILVGTPPEQIALIAAQDAVFVGDTTRLTPVFEGISGAIDGIGAVQSGIVVATPVLAATTTFTLRVRRGDQELQTQTTVRASYRNRIRVLRSAPLAQRNHLAAALPGGRAILMGGNTSAGISVPDSTLTQIFDGATEEFTPGPDLLFTTAAQFFTSVAPLTSGAFVLIGTGPNAPVGALRGVITQLFDPFAKTATPAFTRLGEAPTRGISDRTVTPLLDDAALLTGGQVGGNTPGRSSIADRFDGLTEQWSSAGQMLHVRDTHTATLLRDGRVLIAGGLTCCRILNPVPEFYTNTAEIYDPASGEFTSTGSMSAPRGGHAAVLLPDGRVLVSGGDNDDGALAPVSTEIYDPATGEFSAGGDLQGPRDSHSAIALTDGRILVIGGEVPPQVARVVGVGVVPAEIFDPGTGRWSAGPRLDPAFYGATVTMLSNGKVLIFGGEDRAGFPQSAAALFE